MIYGAYRKWSWLVDPPEYLWPVYSQAFLKKLFGRRFVIGWTYLFGILFVAAMFVSLWTTGWGVSKPQDMGARDDGRAYGT